MRVLLGAALALVLVPAVLAATGPRVRLTDRSPATVAGTGFHTRERVVVTVTANRARMAKTVLTTAGGAFVARFAHDIALAPCGQLAVSAVGARGDRAAWKMPPEVCGAPPQPIGQ
jgi:uncharacterized protein (DUF58 family)